MKSSNFLLTLAVAIILTVPNFALALGQMTEPIVVNNALRGEKIQQELIAVNSDKQAVNVKFTAEGQISEWANFYLPGNLEEPVDTFSLEANGNLRIIAVLEVPEDVANGVYTGNFSVTNVPDANADSEDSVTNVRQKIDRKVTITISDLEEINIGNTSVIPNKFDLSQGEPLSIRVIYDNKGNIRMRPQIGLKIKKDDKNVVDVIYPYPEDEAPVNANSQHEISPIIIQTIGWEEGKYSASLTFTRNGENLLEKNFQFSISPKSSESDSAWGIKLNNNILALGLFVLILIFIIIWQITKRSKN